MPKKTSKKTKKKAAKKKSGAMPEQSLSVVICQCGEILTTLRGIESLLTDLSDVPESLERLENAIADLQKGCDAK